MPEPAPATPTDLDSFLALLRTLVRAPSVVGAEEPFFCVLQRELELHGVGVSRYQGVLAAYGNDPESLILSAHVDRHGIVSTGAEEFEYAAFVTKTQGDLDGNSISEKMADLIGERFVGERVEAYDPWSGIYLGQGEIASAFRCDKRKNVVFQIPDLPPMGPGVPVAYLEHLEVSDGTVSAQLDNVLCVALAVDMFRRGFQGTVLFSAEEEAGRSWRYLLSWLQRSEISTQRLVVLDTSPFADLAEVAEQEIVLRRQDANGVFSEPFVDEVMSTCERLGISYGFKDDYIAKTNAVREAGGLTPRSLGRTELGRLVAATDGEVNGTTLQIPTTGYHTNRETATLASLRAAIRLTDALMGGGSDKVGNRKN